MKVLWLLLLLLLLLAGVIFAIYRRRTKRLQQRAVHVPVGTARASAFNCSSESFVARDLQFAGDFWTRLKSLYRAPKDFFAFGRGLLISGAHILATRHQIDVLYLDKQRTVIHVRENVRPWWVAPLGKAATVLELPPHAIHDSATQVGDVIEIRHWNNRS